EKTSLPALRGARPAGGPARSHTRHPSRSRSSAWYWQEMSLASVCFCRLFKTVPPLTCVQGPIYLTGGTAACPSPVRPAARALAPASHHPRRPRRRAARLYAEHVAGRVIWLSLPLPAVRLPTVGILSAGPSRQPGKGRP